ncbi:MAG: tRNA (adenosine(37)-N6)-threonylcarbamoyltransferase complex ATPase subunit type 1 TsaE [Parcubacteria group bacterium]
MQKELITTTSAQTQEAGRLLAKEFQGGEVICLSGELGAGKTTFTQGLLGGLGLEGPFTSPTFLVMKEYEIKYPISNIQYPIKYQNVYHIDAYRVGTEDILALGWEEMVANPENIIIIEWAERVKEIIPNNAIWINFEWLDENRRKITLSNDQCSMINSQSIINTLMFN